MHVKRGIHELGSDYFREASVLVGVFGLLDKAATEKPIPDWYVWFIFGVSAGLFMLGFILEQMRKK